MSREWLHGGVLPVAIFLLVVTQGRRFTFLIPSMAGLSRRVVVGLAAAAAYILVWVGIEFRCLPAALLAIASVVGTAIGFAALLGVEERHFDREVERARVRRAAGERTEWYKWVFIAMLLILLAAFLIGLFIDAAHKFDLASSSILLSFGRSTV